MRHLVEKIELTEQAMYLIDPEHDEKITVVELDDGQNVDLVISVGDSYIYVDSKLFLGSLRALTTKGERDRLNARR